MKCKLGFFTKPLLLLAVSLGSWSSAMAATPFPATLTNTVSITVPAGWTDPDLSDNTGTSATTPSYDVGLAATKTDGTSSYTPGGTGTYTIVVRNNGGSSAENVTVNDTLPTGLTVRSIVSCAATGTSSCGTLTSGGQVGDSSFEFTDGRVQAGGTETLTFTLDVNYASNLSGPIANSVTITDVESGDTTTATDDAPNNASPTSNLSATKTVNGGSSNYVPGGTLTYDLVFTNAGPSDVIGAVILDNLPTGVTLTNTWSCVADALGSACSAVSGGTTGDTSVTLTADIVNGGTVTVSVPVTFDASSGNF